MASATSTRGVRVSPLSIDLSFANDLSIDLAFANEAYIALPAHAPPCSGFAVKKRSGIIAAFRPPVHAPRADRFDSLSGLL
jgi:hypothetical protein